MQMLGVSVNVNGQGGTLLTKTSQQRLVIYIALTVGHLSEQLDSKAIPRPGPAKKVFAKRPPEVSPFYVPRSREWDFLVHHLIDSTEPGRKIVSITAVTRPSWFPIF